MPAKGPVQTTKNKQANKKAPRFTPRGLLRFSAGLRRFRFRLAQRAVQCAEQGLEAGGGDVFVDADAMHRAFAVHTQFNVCLLYTSDAADE